MPQVGPGGVTPVTVWPVLARRAYDAAEARRPVPGGCYPLKREGEVGSMINLLISGVLVIIMATTLIMLKRAERRRR